MATPLLGSGSSLARRGGGSSVLRDIWGRGSGNVRTLGQTISRTAGGLLRPPSPGTPANNTLGNLVSGQIGAGVGAASMGVLDNTAAADWLAAKTGGWLQPSHVVVGAGMLMRGLGVDRNYLGHGFSAANAALIRGMIPVWLYGMGSRGPSVFKNKMAGNVSVATPNVSGVGESSSAPAAAQPEPIPGEETVA